MQNAEEVVRGLETAGQHGEAIGHLGLAVGMITTTDGVPIANKKAEMFGKEKNMTQTEFGTGLTAYNKRSVTLTKRKP